MKQQQKVVTAGGLGTLVLLALAFSMLFATAALAQEYAEAPMLAERVSAGELPPVAERLPQNPLVVEPLERVGEYGGTWRAVLTGSGDQSWLVRTVGYENLVRWNPEWTEVIPNVAESFEVSEDGTQFTFRLREGMKWSDGAPFTADDILFWYEDIALNEELSPSAPSLLQNGDDVGVVEKVDDTTVRISFETPNGLFLRRLATPDGDELTRFPRHYLERFHPAYNEDGLDALMQEYGVQNWVDLFEQVAGVDNSDIMWQNTDLPTLHAWVLKTPYDGTTTRVDFERNPYYFKVDPEGNQLPYIDHVRFEVVQEREVTLLKAIGGEIDFQWRRIGNLEQRPVLVDNAEEAGYHLHERVPASMNTGVFFLNLTHKNPVKRELYQNKDFRVGLSHAINRQEIIDVLFVSQGEPWQAAPRPESEYYDEAFAKQYTEFDVALANEHLDRAGLTERDGEGFRLGPDGERVTILAEVSEDTSYVDVLGLMQRHFEEVGVELQIRALERSLYETRLQSNDLDASMWSGDGGLGIELDPRWYFPYNYESGFAVAWAYWYTKDPRGEEPNSEAAKRQMELFDQLKATADEAEQEALMREILEIAEEEF